MMRGNVQFTAPMTPVVKKLIVINVVIWFVAVVIVQNFFLKQPYLFQWFGLVPLKVLTQFWVWQPFTYMFIHSLNVFHILFNMLLLWWIGAELELRWGSRFFLTYYLVTGIGAAVIYLLGGLGYYFFSGNALMLQVPVVGASGAIFGLLLAYGLVFGERLIFFMMLFPMKAKHFVLILGAVELVSLLSSSPGSEVANLAHLGGIASGYLFLTFRSHWGGRSGSGRKRKKGRFFKSRRKLKLVVDNEEPKYWN